MMRHHELINELLSLCRGRSAYLEIGVDEGECYDMVRAAHKYCVDPEPKGQFEGLFKMGSDEFFRDYRDVAFDLIFIDGLHTFAQAFSDMVNASRITVDGGFIVMHDANPPDEEHASKERAEGDWNGEVWRAVACAAACAKGWEVFTVDCDWGCAVLQRGAGAGPIEVNARDVEAAAGISFQEFAANRENVINLVSEERFREWVEKRKGETRP